MLADGRYQVFIRKAGKFKFQPNYRFETHRHSETEINFINTGCCVMGIEDAYIPLKAGDCILINPFVHHSFMVDMSRACSITQLEYSAVVPEGIEERIPAFDKSRGHQKFSSCDSLCKALENVCRSFREQKEENEYSCTQLDFALAQLYVILSEQICRARQGEGNELQGVVGEVIQYINQHIEEKLNLEEISQRYHVSDRYIRKYFNKYLGINCSKYISMLRIAKAKEMLWNTNKSITEIALETGFSSSQYFSLVFHKYADMTPMEYREMWRGTIAEV